MSRSPRSAPHCSHNASPPHHCNVPHTSRSANARTDLPNTGRSGVLTRGNRWQEFSCHRHFQCHRHWRGPRIDVSPGAPGWFRMWWSGTGAEARRHGQVRVGARSRLHPSAFGSGAVGRLPELFWSTADLHLTPWTRAVSVQLDAGLRDTGSPARVQGVRAQGYVRVQRGRQMRPTRRSPGLLFPPLWFVHDLCQRVVDAARWTPLDTGHPAAGGNLEQDCAPLDATLPDSDSAWCPLLDRRMRAIEYVRCMPDGRCRRAADEKGTPAPSPVASAAGRRPAPT